MLVLVDGDDNQIGTEEKVRCHQPDGLLHRAFTALVFDSDGRLALCKRSGSKMLWPNVWDGTFASHPMENETYADSGTRRMPYETGTKCGLEYMNKFEYHIKYRDVGSENEICATLVGVLDDPSSVNPNPEEVSDVAWVTPEELCSRLADDADSYCPWMMIALHHLSESENAALEKYSKVLDGWMADGASAQFLAAAEKHLPRETWRVLR